MVGLVQGDRNEEEEEEEEVQGDRNALLLGLSHAIFFTVGIKDQITSQYCSQYSMTACKDMLWYCSIKLFQYYYGTIWYYNTISTIW